MKRGTIYDVAKEADVSLATVSRVINGSDVVKQATKAKVEEAISKLGYKPNAIAQGLALQRTTTIGLIIPEASLVYTGQIINGLCDVAKIYDYNILIHTVTDGITNINEVVDDVIKSRVDGVLIYSDRTLDDSTKLLDDFNIPMVVMGSKVSADTICSVYIDFKKAVKELVSDYLDRGIDNIALLEDRKNSNITSDLYEGIAEAFAMHNKKFENYITIMEDGRSSYKILKNYFANHKHQLMIVNRDSQAFAVLNAARENDISIPDDMELVCMTDTKYNSMVRPEVSSFIMPSYDLGAVSMRLMTKMLKYETVEDKEKCLGFLYQERETTK